MGELNSRYQFIYCTEISMDLKNQEMYFDSMMKAELGLFSSAAAFLDLWTDDGVH